MRQLQLALPVLLFFSHCAAQPVVGGLHNCSNASIAGGYGYAISGMSSIQSNGSFSPFADSGHVTSDGNGHLNGSSTTSQAGQITSRNLSGAYTVNSDCTGSATFTDSSGNSLHINVVIVDNSREVNFIQTDTTLAVSGGAKQQATNCTPETLAGPYGFAISGWYYDASGAGFGFADSGKLTSDGAGNLTVNDTASQGGVVSSRTLSGAYTINTDCTGGATFTDSSGNSYHHNFVVVDSGREVQFIQTDPNTVISGSAKRQFALPSDAILNAASYSPTGVTPGSLFTIFGSGLATGTDQARSLPLPSQLGGASVQVNGHAAPLFYVNPNQINAQMPLEIPPGPVQLTVSVAGASSEPAALTVANAGPGTFTYGQNRAVVVNQNGKINSTSAPAHVGDVVVAYLTGGGPVKASGPWSTGAASPAGASATTLPVNITVGNQSAKVYYLGLTPGLVGLYQANFYIPNVPAGDHLMVVNVGGQDSNASYVSVQ